jgi:phosphoglucomutase
MLKPTPLLKIKPTNKMNQEIFSMNENINNKEYSHAMFVVDQYIKQLTKVVDLECIQNILLSKIQEINRQIVKVKEYEQIQADYDKEIQRHKELRS